MGEDEGGGKEDNATGRNAVEVQLVFQRPSGKLQSSSEFLPGGMIACVGGNRLVRGKGKRGARPDTVGADPKPDPKPLLRISRKNRTEG